MAASGTAAVPRASRAAPARAAPAGLAWAGLAPLALVLHPYRGLTQDARIYVGQALADLEPAGLGRDMLFSDDAQTRFTAMRAVLRASLWVASPAAASAGLALAGLLLWVAAAATLARRLAPGRVAWVAMVAVLVLPGSYGALGAFSYAESIATPRVFAEAAVLAGLAALAGRRRALGLVWLATATALHPLMALPGIATAAVLLVVDDRRWLVPLAAALATLAAGAALHLPLLDRLVVMDDAWLGILRARSTQLFPTLWPADAFSRMACQAAAAIVAGLLSRPRARALLWAGAAVGCAGVAASAAFGDRVPVVLVLQVQPWRSTWLLAVLGDAGLGLAALALWRGGRGRRFTLSVLALAWLCQGAAALSMSLAAAAVALQSLDRAGRPVRPGAALVWAAGAAAAAVAATDVAADAELLRGLFSAPGAEAGMLWSDLAYTGALAAPLLLAATAMAARRTAVGRAWAGPALAAACCAAALLWDGRAPEERGVDARAGLASLEAALGPGRGDVLWPDGIEEAWFLARRPAFFNAVQGAPILFSRPLAMEWADRGRLLLDIGLARPADVAPWGGGEAPAVDIRLTAAAAERFCADPRRPAALVVSGDQADRAPPGWAAGLWRPPTAFARPLFGEAGPAWSRVEAFTVVPCPGP